MAQSLQEFLDSIDPRLTIDQVKARVDEAINAFSAPAQISDWHEFGEFMDLLYGHVECALLRMSAPFDVLDNWAYRRRWIQFLTPLYGSEAAHVAFRMASMGIEGGLRRVMRDMVHGMVERHIDNSLTWSIQGYWHGLTLEEKDLAESEYIAMFRHLLPRDMIGDTPGSRAVSFEKILREHVNAVQRLRDIGQM